MELRPGADADARRTPGGRRRDTRRLRLVLLSGDWIPVDLPDRVRALWPDAEVVSLGGATEASIWSIQHPAGEVEPGAKSVPYGTPLRNQTFHVLDSRMEPCPVWTAGELHIGGVGLARGYWADPQRTAASFVTHPRTGERLYRTGDFGRYRPDGTIEFLGRRDGQVKINGHRVELGEIEATLAAHPGVDSAVVVKAAGQDGATRLLGYVVPVKEDDTLFVTERADTALRDRQWQALAASAGRPAEGPDPEQLRRAWDVLDEVYTTATASAFRAFGLPHLPGAPFDPAGLRGAGVAPATHAGSPAPSGPWSSPGICGAPMAARRWPANCRPTSPPACASAPAVSSARSWRSPRTSASGCSPSPAT